MNHEEVSGDISFESEIERKQRLVLRFLFTELCAVAFEDDGDSLRQ